VQLCTVSKAAPVPATKAEVPLIPNLGTKWS